MDKQSALEQIKQAAFEDELEKMSGFNAALKGLGHSTKNSDRLSYQDDLEPVELNMALENETGKSIPDKIFFKSLEANKVPTAPAPKNPIVFLLPIFLEKLIIFCVLVSFFCPAKALPSRYPVDAPEVIVAAG